MKTYTFTYYNGCDLDSFYRAQEFTCVGTRLSQAIACFADFFNLLSGYKDFSSCYKVVSEDVSEFRHFKSGYFFLFDIVKPDLTEI